MTNHQDSVDHHNDRNDPEQKSLICLFLLWSPFLTCWSPRRVLCKSRWCSRDECPRRFWQGRRGRGLRWWRGWRDSPAGPSCPPACSPRSVINCQARVQVTKSKVFIVLSILHQSPLTFQTVLEFLEDYKSPFIIPNINMKSEKERKKERKEWIERKFHLVSAYVDTSLV